MANTYDTSSLPLGTTSPKALYNNASNFDEFSLSPAPSFIDRKGKRRETIAGMENAFEEFLVASGYVFLGDYAAGVTITRRNQYVIRDGVPYRVASDTALPLVLTGTWATDQPKLVAFNADALVKQDLADTIDPLKGAALIGRGVQVAASIAALRGLKSTSPSQHAFVAAYNAGGSFGGGHYRIDSSDVSSSDNGGTVIVATDGARWKYIGTPNAWTFGCDPSGTTPAQVQRDAFVNWVQSNGGGTCHFPAGVYDFRTEWQLSPVVEGFHAIVITGAGKMATDFNFANCPAGSDGLAWLGWGGRFGMRDFTVKNAPGYGVNFNKGEVRGGPGQISRTFMDNVLVDNCGLDGVRCLQSYMCAFRGVESTNNTLYGFNLHGFHTSMYFENCWAGGDAADPQGGNGGGWKINGMVYSTFIACGGDNNAGPGWVVENCASTSFLNCGAESNGQEGFLCRTSNADLVGIDASAWGLNNVIFDGCFAFNNSQAAAGTHANGIGISTANGIRADVIVRGFRDNLGSSATNSVVLVGASGAILFTEEGNKWANAFYARSGTTSVTNLSVIGKSLVATLSGDQGTSNGVETAVAFDTIYQNRLEAQLIGNTVVTGNGTNRVKVAVGAYWGSSSAGARNIRIVKNGAGIIGAPQLKSIGNGFTGQSLVSAIIEVAPGDTIGVMAVQDSGGGLAIVNNGSTYLSVEAMG